MLAALIAVSFSGCGDSSGNSKVESPEVVSERAVAEFLGPACSQSHTGNERADTITVTLNHWNYVTCEPTDDARPDALVAKCTEAAAGSTCVVTIEGGGAFNVKTKTAPNGCTIPGTLTLKSSPPQGSALDEALGDMSVGDGTAYPSSVAAEDERCS